MPSISHRLATASHSLGQIANEVASATRSILIRGMYVFNVHYETQFYFGGSFSFFTVDFHSTDDTVGAPRHYEYLK